MLSSTAQSIKKVSADDYTDQTLKQLHIAQEEFSLYLDKKSGFILDWPNETTGANDSLIIQFDSKTYFFNTNKGITFKQIKSGDYTIKVGHSYNQSKEEIIKPTKFGLKVFRKSPWFKHEAMVLGLLLLMLGIVFWSESKPWARGFYKYVPGLLLCYFLPAALSSLGIINGQDSELYYIASRYLLPASLVLLCLSIDLKGIINLGPKALIMFFTATLGVVIGGPLALWLVGNFLPDTLGGEAANALWRGLSTVAGSWIGGGANQTAMKEIAECPEGLFSSMILVDVALANLWMAFLLFGAGTSKKVNKWLKADNSAVEKLKEKVEGYQNKIARLPSTRDIVIICTIAFLGVGLAHVLGGAISPAIGDKVDAMIDGGNESARLLTSFGKEFFWLIIISTAIGVGLSFTKARSYEGAGASKIGSLFIYMLVATIGMKINLGDFFQNSQIGAMLMIGAVWMLVHITLLLGVAKLIKAPFFFVAVGSQANIGGAASAPVVASAFSPALAPVGVLLAVLGYAVGTIAALGCMILMQIVSGV